MIKENFKKKMNTLLQNKQNETLKKLYQLGLKLISFDQKNLSLNDFQSWDRVYKAYEKEWRTFENNHREITKQNNPKISRELSENFIRFGQLIPKIKKQIQTWQSQSANQLGVMQQHNQKNGYQPQKPKHVSIDV